MHLLSDKIRRIRTALWSSVVKRHYLLRMKAKYAGIISVYDTLLACHHFVVVAGNSSSSSSSSSSSNDTVGSGVFYENNSGCTIVPFWL